MIDPMLTMSDDLNFSAEECRTTLRVIDRIHLLSKVGAGSGVTPKAGDTKTREVARLLDEMMRREFTKTADACAHLSKWLREYLAFDHEINSKPRKEAT